MPRVRKTDTETIEPAERSPENEFVQAFRAFKHASTNENLNIMISTARAFQTAVNAKRIADLQAQIDALTTAEG